MHLCHLNFLNFWDYTFRARTNYINTRNNWYLHLCNPTPESQTFFSLLFTIISPGRFACQITCSIMYKLVLACHTTMKTLFILHLCCISFIHTEQVELDSKPESLSDGASTSVVLKQSSSTGSNHCFFPCLEFLELYHCRGLTEVANLPPSIKTLNIFDCGSLVSVSG